LFQAIYKEQIPNNSEYKIRELMEGNYHESPQHKLHNTAVTSCFLDTKDSRPHKCKGFGKHKNFTPPHTFEEMDCEFHFTQHFNMYELIAENSILHGLVNHTSIVATHK